MRFQDKIAIVTGGGSGMGKEVATRFVAEGGSVVINGRNAPKAEAGRPAPPVAIALAIAVPPPAADVLAIAVALPPSPPSEGKPEVASPPTPPVAAANDQAFAGPLDAAVLLA
jgi:NAD(P)-dependent dehydrogenase (short-subunit alcohol dehydrogenase family)